MILKLEGVNKSFGGLKAVNEVSLEVGDAEVSSIIGPNGAGKSTLFNLITGHIPCDAGKIIFKEENITGLAPHDICRKGIGRSFQRVNIFPNFTSFDNVRVAVLGGTGRSMRFLRPAKSLVKEETNRILEDIGLLDKADTMSAELSHGDQKRLELGIALANNPKLVLLDEPTAGMSPEETAAIMELIRRLATDLGIALVFVEHDMKVVFGFSEKIRVMHYGSIIAEGTPEEIGSNKEVQSIYLGEEIK